MSQTASGLLILSFMFISMGGVGLYAAWPELNKFWHSLKEKNSFSFRKIK